jgi:enediyne biosynthesis protein E4
VPRSPAALGEWSSASGLADLDRDGHLDLVICSYVAWDAATEVPCRSGAEADYCDVKRYAGLADHVFRGDGRGGFVEHSSQWGFGQVAERGLGLALVDVDGDGWQDIYVANDTDANRLYLNRLGTGGGLEDVTSQSGAAASADGLFEAGMGVALADINRDALPDLLVGNFAGESNSLYLSLGGGRFQESSRRAGIAAPSLHPLTFGVAFQDFDGDGLEDFFAVCGHVLRHVDEAITTWGWAQVDLLLRQDQPGHFTPAPLGSYLGEAWSSRGLATGDLDGDLLPDVVSSCSGGPLRVAFNRQQQLGSGPIAVTLVDRRAGISNRQAIGSELTLTLSDGSRQRRYLRAGSSYLSQDAQVSHFALPAGLDAGELQVRWPDGSRTTHPAPPVGALSAIAHPDGL